MINRCFVIGPMNQKHMPILRWLANDVVAKILENRNFEVYTPDVPEAGNILHHIIRACDRAQLVIADTTGNNPNVLYEMAVLDAMGRPCIPVKISGIETETKDMMPFDRAAYRYFVIEANKTKEAINRLDPVINKALLARETGDLMDNPLTDFFGVPLSSLSAAHGSAQGYFFNLVVPCMKGKIIKGPSHVKGKKNFTLQTIIPDRVEYATRQAIDDLVKEKTFIPITVEAPGRKVETYIWSDKFVKRSNPVIVDIPTALGTLHNIVIARLGRNTNPNPNSNDYKELEQDEILQFKRSLQRFVDVEFNKQGFNRKNFKIIDVKDCIFPDLFT
jgi:hypothetical protein